ncbi:hypothetical protein [Phenylobacterium sp.]|uniref:hypothetical protein n=1 Tax=Phenylobacterium sp. TaxID=1871053 RepID=UPI0035AEE764
MRRSLLAVACLLGLAACDTPKPRPAAPPPPQAAAPPDAAAPKAEPAPALSAGLASRGPASGFFLDQVGQAVDPANRKPAATSAAAPLTIIGFAFDDPAKMPAKGVDVVLDGVARPATYGQARPDVAAYFKNPALTNVGFTADLPAGTLPPGPHKVSLRVIAADGAGYFETPQVEVTVR